MTPGCARYRGSDFTNELLGKNSSNPDEDVLLASVHELGCLVHALQWFFFPRGTLSVHFRFWVVSRRPSPSHSTQHRECMSCRLRSAELGIALPEWERLGALQLRQYMLQVQSAPAGSHMLCRSDGTSQGRHRGDRTAARGSRKLGAQSAESAAQGTRSVAFPAQQGVLARPTPQQQQQLQQREQELMG